MEINKGEKTSVVLVGKFLAASSIYIVTSWVVRDQDLINAMALITEKMGWLVNNQEFAKVQIIKSIVYVAKNLADEVIWSTIIYYTQMRNTNKTMC